MSATLSLTDRAIEHKDRASWLAARRQGIGGSEAAAVLGICPYRSPLQLYLAKTGEDIEQRETWAMKLGTAAEPILSAEYRRRYATKLHEQVFLRHEEHPWMFATLDGVTPDGTVVEFKTAGWRQAREWGEEDSDEVPLPYLVQVQHQIAVAGLDTAHVFASIDREEPKRFIVHRNDELISILVKREQAFWQHVCNRTRLESPGLEQRFALQSSDHKVMHLLYPEAEGAIPLGQPEADLIDRRAQISMHRRELDQEDARLKTDLLGALGPFASGSLPDGRTITRKVRHVEETTMSRKAYSFVDLRVRKAGA